MNDCLCSEFPIAEEKNWDNKESVWNDKAFYQANISMLFNMPNVYNNKLTKSIKEIEEKGYKVCQPLRILSREGWLGGQLLIEIDNPGKIDPRVQTFKNTRFISKVYRGKKHLLSLGVKQFVFELEQKGEVVTDIYYWNITCSSCVKKKGYITVILAKV